MRDALAAAHRAVRRVTAAEPRWLGASAIVAWRRSGLLVVGHAGDTRCYRLRGAALTPLTADQPGACLAFEDADGRPDPTVYDELPRMLGVANCDPVVRVERPAPGDRYLLASASLCGALDDAALRARLAAGACLDEVVEALVAEGMARGAESLAAVVLDWTATPRRGPAGAGTTPARAPTPDEVAALAARALRPDRPRLDAARAAVAGHDDPRAAWEALAARGVVPAAWVDAPDRGFLGPARTRLVAEADLLAVWRDLCAGGAHVLPDRWIRDGRAITFREVLPHPPTVAAAVALASDPAGVAAAEHLAEELAARVRPWGHGGPARAVWLVTDPAAPVALVPSPDPMVDAGVLGHLCMGDVAPAAAQALAAAGRSEAVAAWLAALVGGASGWARPRRADATAAWVELAARHTLGGMGGVDPAELARCWADARRAHPFADLPSPFAPLLSIAAHGYAVAGLTTAGRLLVAPPV